MKTPIKLSDEPIRKRVKHFDNWGFPTDISNEDFEAFARLIRKMISDAKEKEKPPISKDEEMGG